MQNIQKATKMEGKFITVICDELKISTLTKTIE